MTITKGAAIQICRDATPAIARHTNKGDMARP
jgi:hypothetical protein